VHEPVVDARTFVDRSRGLTVDSSYPILSDDYLQALEEKGYVEPDGTPRADLVEGIKKIYAHRYRELLKTTEEHLNYFLVRLYAYFGRRVPLRGMPEVPDRLITDDLPGCRVERARLVEIPRRTERLAKVLPADRKDVIFIQRLF